MVIHDQPHETSKKNGMAKYPLLLRSCYTGVSNLSLQLISNDMSMMKAETSTFLPVPQFYNISKVLMLCIFST